MGPCLYSFYLFFPLINAFFSKTFITLPTKFYICLWTFILPNAWKMLLCIDYIYIYIYFYWFSFGSLLISKIVQKLNQVKHYKIKIGLFNLFWIQAEFNLNIKLITYSSLVHFFFLSTSSSLFVSYFFNLIFLYIW